ncbi:MAG: PAS-domain containing protein [Pseudomonadota bacterium]
MPFMPLGQTLLIVAICAAAVLAGFYLAPLLRHFFAALKKRSVTAHILNQTSAIIWEERDGQVVWSNKRHQEVEAKLDRKVRYEDFAFDAAPEGECHSRLGQLKVGTDDQVQNFEVSKSETGSKTIYTAFEATAFEHAEHDRKRFIQILGDTFAHNPIGMAVFDKNRDLTLFNPALSDSLECKPSWLAQGPNLRSFLDHLHNDGALPEPKDYNEWREKLVEMERNASDGSYDEDWYLPNQKVLRVTGRPHPQGAVAFFFEDISREVAVERDYRLELERYHAIFDALEPGIAVFDSAGHLNFSNEALDAIMGTEYASAMSDLHIAKVTQDWQSNCNPNPIFGEIRDFAQIPDEKAQWDGYVRLSTGNRYHVVVSPVLNRSFVVTFTQTDSVQKIEEVTKESA